MNTVWGKIYLTHIYNITASCSCIAFICSCSAFICLAVSLSFGILTPEISPATRIASPRPIGLRHFILIGPSKGIEVRDFIFFEILNVGCVETVDIAIKNVTCVYKKTNKPKNETNKMLITLGTWKYLETTHVNDL